MQDTRKQEHRGREGKGAKAIFKPLELSYCTFARGVFVYAILS